MLDRNHVATVEDLRALLVEELAALQTWLRGSETDPLDTFYTGGEHVDENTGRNRIVDRLSARMTALGLPVVIERHMADGNRCDITVSAALPGTHRLLVIEVKGQWNAELYTAASAQLAERYAIHPDAAGQGIFLVFWYGPDVSVAGRVTTGIASADALKDAIVAQSAGVLAGRDRCGRSRCITRCCDSRARCPRKAAHQWMKCRHVLRSSTCATACTSTPIMQGV